MVRIRPLLSLVGFIFLLLLIASFGAGCSQATSDKSLYVSGMALYSLGDQFVKTAQLYSELHENHQITEKQYNDWLAFATKFQIAYPQTVEMWRAAKAHGDFSSASKIIESFMGMKGQLMTFYTMAIGGGK